MRLGVQNNKQMKSALEKLYPTEIPADDWRFLLNYYPKLALRFPGLAKAGDPLPGGGNEADGLFVSMRRYLDEDVSPFRNMLTHGGNIANVREKFDLRGGDWHTKLAKITQATSALIELLHFMTTRAEETLGDVKISMY